MNSKRNLRLHRVASLRRTRLHQMILKALTETGDVELRRVTPSSSTQTNYSGDLHVLVRVRDHFEDPLVALQAHHRQVIAQILTFQSRAAQAQSVEKTLVVPIELVQNAITPNCTPQSMSGELVGKQQATFQLLIGSRATPRPASNGFFRRLAKAPIRGRLSRCEWRRRTTAVVRRVDNQEEDEERSGTTDSHHRWDWNELEAHTHKHRHPSSSRKYYAYDGRHGLMCSTAKFYLHRCVFGMPQERAFLTARTDPIFICRSDLNESNCPHNEPSSCTHKSLL